MSITLFVSHMLATGFIYAPYSGMSVELATGFRCPSQYPVAHKAVLNFCFFT